MGCLGREMLFAALAACETAKAANSISLPKQPCTTSVHLVKNRLDGTSHQS